VLERYWASGWTGRSDGDCPYEDYAEGGEFIDTVAISERDRRKIAFDNSSALYKL